MRAAIIENGIVVNIAEATLEFAQDQGWIEAPENIGIGWAYDGATWTPPEPPDPVDEPAQPVLYAVAQLKISNGDISGIDINSRFAAAFWGDVGKYYVFFAEPLPDASYMVMASAGPCNAYVLDSEKEVDFFVITVTDATNAPVDADAVNISIIRAI